MAASWKFKVRTIAIKGIIIYSWHNLSFFSNKKNDNGGWGPPSYIFLLVLLEEYYMVPGFFFLLTARIRKEESEVWRRMPKYVIVRN